MQESPRAVPDAETPADTRIVAGLSTNYHPGAPDKSGYTISGHEGAERKEEYNSTQESGDRWGRHGDMAAAGEAVGAAASAEDVEASVEIVHGEPFTDRKSTFQAHLARVSSEQQARRRYSFYQQ